MLYKTNNDVFIRATERRAWRSINIYFQAWNQIAFLSRDSALSFQRVCLHPDSRTREIFSKGSRADLKPILCAHALWDGKPPGNTAAEFKAQYGRIMFSFSQLRTMYHGEWIGWIHRVLYFVSSRGRLWRHWVRQMIHAVRHILLCVNLLGLFLSAWENTHVTHAQL